jgi:hypothetical protein
MTIAASSPPSGRTSRWLHPRARQAPREGSIRAMSRRGGVPLWLRMRRASRTEPALAGPLGEQEAQGGTGGQGPGGPRRPESRTPGSRRTLDPHPGRTRGEGLRRGTMRPSSGVSSPSPTAKNAGAQRRHGRAEVMRRNEDPTSSSIGNGTTGLPSLDRPSRGTGRA